MVRPDRRFDVIGVLSCRGCYWLSRFGETSAFVLRVVCLPSPWLSCWRLDGLICVVTGVVVGALRWLSAVPRGHSAAAYRPEIMVLVGREGFVKSLGRRPEAKCQCFPRPSFPRSSISVLRLHLSIRR